jgi:methylated-DNA-[protein]-cysteine S-methyltransferase
MYCYNTKIGPITIEGESDNCISKIFLGNNCLDGEETPYIKKAYTQTSEYLNGKRKAFDLNLKLYGTEFQQVVWNALLKIPYGETRSYKDIAETIGSPYAYRAVGLACNRNPICIVIPCHRIIGSRGNLTRYAGGLDIKKQLLEMQERS